jgi:hypothetical protein
MNLKLKIEELENRLKSINDKEMILKLIKLLFIIRDSFQSSSFMCIKFNLPNKEKIYIKMAIYMFYHDKPITNNCEFYNDSRKLFIEKNIIIISYICSITPNVINKFERLFGNEIINSLVTYLRDIQLFAEQRYKMDLNTELTDDEKEELYMFNNWLEI